MPLFLSDDAQREESFRKQVLVAVNDKNVEIENYKNRFIEIHRNEFQSSTNDAEKWADNFIATLQIKRDKTKEIEQEKQREIEKEKVKLPILFEYIVSTFDGKVSALAKRIQGIKLEGSPRFDLFQAQTGDNNKLTIRKIVFENGISLCLILSQGSLGKEGIKTFPKITCTEISKKPLENPILFEVRKHQGHFIRIGPKPLIYDIEYELKDDAFMNERLKAQIAEAFQQAIETAFLR
jgi:hypothetical protein